MKQHLLSPRARRLFFASFIARLLLLPALTRAQLAWNKDGNSYTMMENGALVEATLPAMTHTTLIPFRIQPAGAQPSSRSPPPTASPWMPGWSNPRTSTRQKNTR